uniref:Uncharacterized protein n=1 Tax=Heterorhabditis bacteriophora TaxID=37862 RepID=A0A1I7WJV0_HETBA
MDSIQQLTVFRPVTVSKRSSETHPKIKVTSKKIMVSVCLQSQIIFELIEYQIKSMQETIHLYSRTLSSTSSESSGSCEVWLEESLWRYRPSPFYFSYLVIPDNLFHVFSRLRYDTALKGVSTIGGSDRRPLRWW